LSNSERKERLDVRHDVQEMRATVRASWCAFVRVYTHIHIHTPAIIFAPISNRICPPPPPPIDRLNPPFPPLPSPAAVAAAARV